MTSPRPLLVFADDWGRHPSSCQHLVRELLPTRAVVWVNTIGTRPPRLDLSTLRRAAGKLRTWGGAKPAEASEPGPRVVSPKMWPSFRSAFGRRLNRSLLLKSLAPVVAGMPQAPVAITTLPLVADLVGRLKVHAWLYYRVDDFSVWPGYDGATMLRMERELLPKVQSVVAVSETLQADLGRPSHLLTHGVNPSHWRAEPSTDFAELEPPIVLFWGVIDRRMDLSFVRATATAMPAGTLVFVGPREDPDPELFRIPRVVARPPAAFAKLPGLAAAAQVLIMPYADLPVTRAMQPLKMKEYLATGKPVVVRDLPATRPWADALDVCATADAFALKVVSRRAGIPLEQQLARRRLDAESWHAKAALFASWIAEIEA